MILKLIFYLLLSTILINTLEIKIKLKVFINIIFFILYSYYFYSDLKFFILSSIIYTNFLYICINFYTTKISSIRIKILEQISKNTTIMTEESLYHDRIKRINNINSNIQKNLLFIFLKLIIFFRILFNCNDN